jgi:hypothetical protein
VRRELLKKLVYKRRLIEKRKTATPFKNSVVIGHWHKNAKVIAKKTAKIKTDKEKVYSKQLTSSSRETRTAMGRPTSKK